MIDMVKRGRWLVEEMRRLRNEAEINRTEVDQFVVSYRDLRSIIEYLYDQGFRNLFLDFPGGPGAVLLWGIPVRTPEEMGDVLVCAHHRGVLFMPPRIYGTPRKQGRTYPPKRGPRTGSRAR